MYTYYTIFIVMGLPTKLIIKELIFMKKIMNLK